MKIRKKDKNINLFSFINLYHCYLKCRKNKRNTINALKFEVNLEENLLQLSHELQQRKYQLSRAIAFVVTKPKLREIIASDFRDRVVHHLLISELEKIYEPVFIYDSYACRKNKGTHKAVARARYFMHQLQSRNGKAPYFLQMDMALLHRSLVNQNLLILLLPQFVESNHYLC